MPYTLLHIQAAFNSVLQTPPRPIIFCFVCQCHYVDILPPPTNAVKCSSHSSFTVLERKSALCHNRANEGVLSCEQNERWGWCGSGVVKTSCCVQPRQKGACAVDSNHVLRKVSVLFRTWNFFVHSISENCTVCLHPARKWRVLVVRRTKYGTFSTVNLFYT